MNNHKKDKLVLNERKILIAEDDPDHAELIIDELNTGDIRNEIILKKNGQIKYNPACFQLSQLF